MTSKGTAAALAVGLAAVGSALAGADAEPGRLVNRMAAESSSYLRRHAGDPVAWQPWGDEAFALAQRLGRPVFVSIGFFSCHWCHVLQEESFGDAGIARLLNERYVPVLVDRDERPDVDVVYQAAMSEVGGSGGWPLNLWLTPEREPFFGASYLPKEDGERGFERGLRTVLDRLASSWSADPGPVRATAGRVAGLAVDRMRPPPPADLPSPGEVTAALGRVLASVDPVHGGRRGGPKFPLGLPLEWMLREGGEAARPAVERTLDGIVAGAVHDVVGGGFFRYAVDPAWRRPHFEKLLGDQARIAVVLLEAGRRLDRPDLVAASRRTLDFVAREMLLPDGGFAPTLDADSPGPEGRPCEGCFYAWTDAELDAALDPEAARALRARFAIEPLEPSGDRGVLVRKPGLLDEGPRVAEALASLLARRRLRPPPPRDERASLAASGLAIGAFARAALVLDEASFEGIARRAAVASLAERERRRGAGGDAPETLDDLAAMVAGLLDLYEASGDARWFESAVALSSEIDDAYADPASGGYFLIGREADSPLLRPRSLDDGPLPAGASLQAMSLLRIAAWTGDDRPRRRAIEALRSSAPALLPSPWTRGDFALALRFLAANPVEVVLVAPRDLSELTALRAPVQAPGAPDRVLSLTTSERAATDGAKIPLLAGKRAIGGRATAYVCRRHVCERPTNDPAELERQLRSHEGGGSEAGEIRR